MTEFDWDVDKEAANRRKHGIGFHLAIEAFGDPLAITELDRIEGGEYRWRTIGMVRGVTILVVAHTYRDDSESGEVVRIISARAAERRERRRYEQS